MTTLLIVLYVIFAILSVIGMERGDDDHAGMHYVILMIGTMVWTAVMLLKL